MAKFFRALGLPIFLGFLFLAIYLVIYLGAFKGVEVKKEVYSGMVQLYVEHLGAYHKIGASLERVEDWAKKNGFSCLKTFGEYFDNPKLVDEDRLRSHAGCLLELPMSAEQVGLLPEGFKHRSVPAREYVIATFMGSPAIGPWKVYPEMDEYIESQRLATEPQMLEIYTIFPSGEMETTYLKPLDEAAD